MTLLGLDYGTVRVGVACSFGSLAEPVKILANDDTLWVEIAALVQTYQPQLIVVGLSENKMAAETRQFVNELQEKIDIPVIYQDETLSSHEVHALLRDAPAHKKRGPIDHFAAAVILQRYLDAKTAT